MSLLNKLRWARHRRRREQELREELQFHFEEAMEEGRAAGLTDEQARAAARRDLGNTALVIEDTRAGWTWTWLERVAQDLRYAGRMMRRRPAFTAAAVVSLSLGIGANSAMFSLLNALFLERLPVTAPHELVRLFERARDGSPRDDFVYTTYDTLRRGSTLLSAVIVMTKGSGWEVEEAGNRAFAAVQLVSDNYFDVLGVGALRGRIFHVPPPGTPGEPIVVISEDYWRRRYNASTSAIGTRLSLNRREFTIAGIAPRGFRGTEVDRPIDIWIPFDQVVAPDSDDRTRGRWVRIMGRLAPERTIEQAQAESAAILNKPVQLLPGSTGYSNLRTRFARPLLFVELVVVTVLFITCLNLANLMLAGTAAREHELAVRRSLGASAGRVARQLLTESLLLAGIAGLLSVIVARWITTGLLTFLPPEQALALAHLRFGLDATVLGFTVGLSVLAGVLFGLGPAWRAARADDAAPALRSRTLVATRSWTGRSLVVGQIAMCIPLLLVAGICLRSVHNLRGQDAGYEERGVLVADVDPPRGYSEERRDQLFEELRALLAALPGVRIAAFSHLGQLSGSGHEWPIGFPGRAFDTGDAPVVFEQRITPGFLAAMGTRITAGRDFAETDTATSAPVAIVNESFARTFLPGRKPIGQRFFREGGSRAREIMEIVGVVRDSKWVNLRDDAPPMYYRPYSQQGGTPVVRFAIRTDGDLRALAGALRQAAQDVDKRIVLRNVVPFHQVVDRTLVAERLVGYVSGAFSILALAIAAVGLYGVLAYAVARRTREIGVRIAVGASPGSVEWMILRESLALFGIACVIGIPLAMAAARQVSYLLFGLEAQDPLTAGAVLCTLLAATVIASCIPARRAAAVDPVVALRHE